MVSPPHAAVSAPVDSVEPAALVTYSKVPDEMLSVLGVVAPPRRFATGEKLSSTLNVAPEVKLVATAAAPSEPRPVVELPTVNVPPLTPMAATNTESFTARVVVP